MIHRKNNYLFIGVLLALSICTLDAANFNKYNAQFQKPAIKDKALKKPLYISKVKSDPAFLLVTHLLFEACLGHPRVARYFHPKGTIKVPEITLFISDISKRGRDLGDIFDQPLINTDMVYDKKIEELRQGTIKGLIEARDISFECAGLKLGKLIQQGASKIPAFKIAAFALGTELLLETKYINEIFPANEAFLQDQHIQEIPQRVKEIKEKNANQQHEKINQRPLNIFNTRLSDNDLLKTTYSML